MIKHNRSEDNFRLLYPSFWTDGMIQDMLVKKQRNEVLFFLLTISNHLAAVNHSLSGIYEIHTGGINMQLHFTAEELDSAINLFNKNYSSSFAYDKTNHMIFIKKFFLYNKKNKTAENICRWLKTGFDKTYSKAPTFWAEFSEIYRKDLSNIYKKLGKSDHEDLDELTGFLDQLIEVKNLSSNSIILLKNKK